MRPAVLISGVIAVAVAVALLLLFRPTQVSDTAQTGSDAGGQANVPAQEALPSLAFDIVRVSRTGTAVIAGRADPGRQVRIMDGTALLGTVEADETGSWVFILDEPLAAGARELGLEVIDSAGNIIQSSEIVVVRVPEPDENRDAIAVLTARDGSGPSRVVQGLAGEDLEIGVGSVDYDEEGQVMLSGWALPGSRVLAYLNNDPIGETIADEDGFWDLTAERMIPPGVYSLRIDQVNELGQVARRVELPFERALVADLAGLDIGQSIVQPGNSLWRIARRIYGRGARYTVIYEANRDQIRDPDLIYPGQVFSIPPVEGDRG